MDSKKWKIFSRLVRPLQYLLSLMRHCVGTLNFKIKRFDIVHSSGGERAKLHIC